MLNLMAEKIIEKNPQYLGMENVVEKELLHHDILYFLSFEGYLDRLTFIGGTALRMCYGSNRLSEDLDFAGGLNFDKKDFDGLAAKLKDYLFNIYNLEVDVREPQVDKGDTSTWKMTIEKYPGKHDKKSQKMHIDVCAYPALDIEYHAAADHYKSGSKIAGLPIGVESLAEISADKIIAFAYRQRRIKPRDVWDLVWLNQKQVDIPIGLVKQKLGYRKKDETEFLSLIRKHAGLITSGEETKQDFYQEMRRFVTPEIAKNTLDNKHFWTYVSGVIERYVDSVERQLGDDKSAEEGSDFPFKM
jgi:predicted nucleotidyltransferase component of viral defense system